MRKLNAALYAAIAVCLYLTVFGGRFGAPHVQVTPAEAASGTTDSGAPAAEGLAARQMVLAPGDLPDGYRVDEQGPFRGRNVTDGYQRLLGGCECEIGESLPLGVLT